MKGARSPDKVGRRAQQVEQQKLEHGHPVDRHFSLSWIKVSLNLLFDSRAMRKAEVRVVARAHTPVLYAEMTCASTLAIPPSAADWIMAWTTGG